VTPGFISIGGGAESVRAANFHATWTMAVLDGGTASEWQSTPKTLLELPLALRI
jgi:hypothetical protein